MTLDECRRFYADEIRLVASLGCDALPHAFAHVPRENYLGPPPWTLSSPEGGMLATAGLGSPGQSVTSDPRDLYHNVLVVIDAARRINNGQPSALARWMGALDVRRGDRVYHLGCGVGYYTAILAEATGPGGSVIASEIDPDLAARAAHNLAAYPNVTVHAGDGAALDAGACDAILVNAGATHPLPVWLDGLKPGGRLVLPITVAIKGSPAGNGVMVKIVRSGSGFCAQVLSSVAIYSCAGARDPGIELSLGKALSTRALLTLKSVRRDEHEEGVGCLAHGRGVCLSQAEPVIG